MLALSPLSSRAHKSRSCERNRQDHRTPRPISRKRLMLLPVRSSLALTRNMHERGSFRCSIIEDVHVSDIGLRLREAAADKPLAVALKPANRFQPPELE